jgi:hypothetical protein
MNYRLLRLGVVGLVLIASATPAMAASAATVDATAEDTLCTIAGAVATTPGITYTPAPGKYTVKGTMDCTSGHKGTGKLTGNGAGALGCSGGKNDATLTIGWKDGTSSTLDVTLADFAYGTGGIGKVTKGAMEGSKVGLTWAREAAAAEAKCAAGGIKSYQFAGGVAFTS